MEKNENRMMFPAKVEISTAYKTADSFDLCVENRPLDNQIKIYKQLSGLAKLTDEFAGGIELTSNLYETVISITSKKEAQKIISELWENKLLFAFPSEKLSDIYEENEKYILMNGSNLGDVALEEVTRFNKVRNTYSALRSALKNADNQDIVTAAFYLYIENFEIDEEENPIMSIKDVSVIYNEELGQYVLVTNKDIRDCRKALSRIEKSNYPKQVGCHPFKFDFPNITYKLEDCIKLLIWKYINPALEGVKMRQDIGEQLIILHCPTVLAAMYQKMIVEAFNEDEYRQCQKCGKYFKLDKWHPQTLCDEHMAVRRRKRQNYAKKKTNELSEKYKPDRREMNIIGNLPR